MANLANRQLFAENFLTIIYRYIKTVFGICTDCSLFTKFFLTNSFYLYGSPKFYPAKYFPCLGAKYYIVVGLYNSPGLNASLAAK